MNKNYLIAVVIGIVVVGGGALYFINSNSSINSVDNQELSANTESVEVNSDQAESQTGNDNPATSAEVNARYLDYSEADFANAVENDGKAVLFFAALAWCPSCQAADKDITSNFNQIPKDVTILKVDYDTAKEMKNKYGITMQDTFVQVDENGEEITRWNSGGQGVQALLANAR